jgi:hypothetical protein
MASTQNITAQSLNQPIVSRDSAVETREMSRPQTPVPSIVDTVEKLDTSPSRSGASQVEMIDGRPKDIFDRFTKSEKNQIVAVVSYSAFISPVTSSVFLPSIPQMSAELHTTAAVIDYTVSPS